MLSLILVEAGLRPSFVIGADVNEIGTNAVWDAGEWLVVEADESYGTFRAIRPDLAVLTNVEPDHLDYYGTFDVLRAAFADFVAGPTGAPWCAPTTPRRRPSARARGDHASATATGVDLRDGRARAAAQLGLLHPARARRRARARAHRRARDSTTPGTPRSPRWRRSRPARPSRRPRRPSPASPASPGASSSAARRTGVTFVDDYAHLPTEVRAALATARSGGWSRVVAVFQPHRFSRTAALADAVRHRLRRRRRPGRHRRLRRRRATRSPGSRAGWSSTPCGRRTRGCP